MAGPVDDIMARLKTAFDHDMTLDTQYLEDLASRQSVVAPGKTGVTLFYSGGLQADGNGVGLSSINNARHKVAIGCQ